MSDNSNSSSLHEGFVYLKEIDPSIIQSVRYYSSDNFIGRRIAGYEGDTIILTEVAARALSEAQKSLSMLSMGKYSLVVFDGYRPQTAVDDFMSWSKDPEDIKMKDSYYPNIPDKTKLFELGYIAAQSFHSRGSTVDLSIAFVGTKDSTLELLPMGSNFDVFDPVSHFNCPSIDEQGKLNRRMLRDLMESHGFESYDEEWWHFTFINGSFPDTYFSFPAK